MRGRTSVVLIAFAVCLLATMVQGYPVPSLKGPFDLRRERDVCNVIAKVHVDDVEQIGKAQLDLTSARQMEARCTVIAAIKGKMGKTIAIRFVVEEETMRDPKGRWGMPSLEKGQNAIVFADDTDNRLRLAHQPVLAVAEAITYTHGNRPGDKLLDELTAWAVVEGPSQAEAIVQVGAYADERAADALRKLMATVKPELRPVITAALIRVDAAPPLEEIKKYITEADVTQAIYDRSGSPVNDPETERARSSFRRGVSGLDYAAYLRECLPLVKPEQVESVMYAVWQVNREETVPVLAGLMDDKSAQVRRWAVGCLRQIVEGNNRVPGMEEFARTGGDEVKSWKKWWDTHQDAFIEHARQNYLGQLFEGLDRLAQGKLPGHRLAFDGRLIHLKWKTQAQGPSPDGLILTVWLSSESDPAKRPQTIEHDGQWSTELRQVDVPWLRTNLFFNLERGAKTDPELVKLFAAPGQWLVASHSYGRPQTQPTSRPGRLQD